MKSNAKCRKCGNSFVFKQDETKWIERGTYSEKIVICPDCGSVVVVKYVEAPGLNVNYDRRYY